MAFVVVPLAAVKFWRVEEPVTKSEPSVPMVVVEVCPILKESPTSMLAKRLVEVASVVVERRIELKI